MFKVVLLSKFGNIYEFNSKEKIKEKKTNKSNFYYSCEINSIDIDEIVYLTNIVAIFQYEPSKLNGTKRLTVSVNNGQDKIIINNLSDTSIATHTDKNNQISIKSKDIKINYYHNYFEFVELEETNLEVIDEETNLEITKEIPNNYNIVSRYGNRYDVYDILSFKKVTSKIGDEEFYSLIMNKKNSTCIMSGAVAFVGYNPSEIKYKNGNYILNVDFYGQTIKIKNVNRTDVKINTKDEGSLYVHCKDYRIHYFFKACSGAYLSNMSSDMSSNIKKIINKNSKSMVLSL
jgi:hypothetical protein